MDREIETMNLLDLIRYPDYIDPTNSFNIVISGPWGCGKTEFMRALTYSLSKIEDFLIMYMNLPKSYVKEEFYATTDINIIQVIEEFITSTLGIRSKIITCIYDLINYLSKRFKLKDKRLIIILDEVVNSIKQIGLTIRDLVTGLSKEIYDIAWKFHCQIHTILVTSEQTALYEFKREEGKNLLIYQIWHLNKDSFIRILQEINCPIDHKLIVELSGYCPRIVHELKILNWNLEKWISKIIENVQVTLKKCIRELGKNIQEVIKELLNTIENVDKIEYTKLWDYLLENNIVTPLFNKWLSNKPSKDTWIGDYVAYKIPAYYYVIKTIVNKRSIDITIQDILKEIEE